MAVSPKPGKPPLERRAIRVRGLVQGVGFRPHAYRCASRLGLVGFVRNDPGGVNIQVQGTGLDEFTRLLRETLPPLARIDSLIEQPLKPNGELVFEIAATHAGAAQGAALPADVALCEECLTELFDPDNRRYLHPFIACCNCGPRYSMTRKLPYDRRNTAMADFALCQACESEYSDPGNRRFHAEPVACHHCGPRLSGDIGETAERLKAGQIVAIKGVGGYNLACNARDDVAVGRLRQRKQRDGKPFAIMVLNTASASRHIDLDASARTQLLAAERPVVIAPNKEHECGLSRDLSRGLGTLGVMLPYTGLHYLLFHALLQSPPGETWLEEGNDLALVMTSANISGEPLIADAFTAQQQLSGVADAFLHHDRDIPARVDDSVLRVHDGQYTVIRRARGFAPHAVKLEHDGPSILALGPQLKSTITLTHGRRAYISPHVGDLGSPASIAFHAHSAMALEQMVQPQVQAIACDLARDFATTRLGEQLSQQRDLPLIRVQHHHAHVAAVLAEHRVSTPVLGLALDGHGEGPAGEAWGGELLLVDKGRFTRLGHLAALPLPGGDRAAKEPWRMAAGALHQLGRGEEIVSRFSDQPLAQGIASWLENGETAYTTAAGRLFDTAAGLLGVCHFAGFEGEPPMLLEGLADRPLLATGAYQIQDGVLDFSPLLRQLADCPDITRGAREFHGTLIQGLLDWVTKAAKTNSIDTVALCGGCFLNSHLRHDVPKGLARKGLRVLQARMMPTNDGSVSLGQAWVAQHSLEN